VRIVCLTPDASGTSLVRLYPIAKVLERKHDVLIAGFRTGPSEFRPYKDEFDYLTVQTGTLPHFLREMRPLVKRLEADLVYAFKPRSTSLWTGLAARRRLGAPLMVDIEDWELGWFLDRTPAEQLKHLAHLEQPSSYLWTGITELLVRFADERLVVSRWLQRRFGGTLLPHGADTSVFDPNRFERGEALRKIGLPDAHYIVFCGAPMPNKGIEDLLVAVRDLGRDDTRVLVVGTFDHDPAYRRRLTERFEDLMTLVGPRPHAEMPLFLSVASIVALPQRETRETTAQVPGKVYEAMAMGRAILATAVSDLPEILDGCGVVVPAGDQDALTRALGQLLDDPAVRTRLGEAARRRCEDRYSWNAMERILDGVLERVVET
jgi:glycosyltransferase involved in cell wall biosynthesis